MTTEDDFQAALDLNPEDWQTRLVFADWLQERDDLRAEGYRALGTMRRQPIFVGASIFREAGIFRRVPSIGEPSWLWRNFRIGPRKHLNRYPAHLGVRWCFLALCELAPLKPSDFDSRQHAEDCAARAFLKLPAKRRSQLLTSFTLPPLKI